MRWREVASSGGFLSSLACGCTTLYPFVSMIAALQGVTANEPSRCLVSTTDASAQPSVRPSGSLQSTSLSYTLSVGHYPSNMPSPSNKLRASASNPHYATRLYLIQRDSGPYQ